MNDERRRKLMRYTKTASYSRIAGTQDEPLRRKLSFSERQKLFLLALLTAAFWGAGLFCALIRGAGGGNIISD